MEEIKCKQVGMLSGNSWDKCHETNRRVYSSNGLSPTITTMGGGQREVKILEPKVQVIGNYSPSKHNASSIVDVEGIAPTVMENHGTVTAITEPLAYDEQNGYLRQDGCVGTLTTDGSSPKHNNRIVEPICLNSKVDGKQPSLTDRVYDTNGISTCVATTPFYMGNIIEPSYRIRKLTERECFRLMGVKQKDFERVAANQSMSSRYHLAGDSIVTSCLMAIFGELLSVDYQSKIKELEEELKQ